METGRQRLNDEKKFYNSVDQNNARSSCSCQTLALFFIILFFLTSSGIIYLARKLQNINAPSGIIGRVLHLNIGAHQIRTITIYQIDLQSKLSGPLGRAIPLSAKEIFIKPEGLIINGQLASSPKTKLSFIAEPVIKNQKIVLTNVRPVDRSLLNNNVVAQSLYSSIAKTLALALNQLAGASVSDIHLKDGEMLITIY